MNSLTLDSRELIMSSLLKFCYSKVIHGPSALTLPGSLLEMKNLRFHPRPNQIHNFHEIPKRLNVRHQNLGSIIHSSGSQHVAHGCLGVSTHFPEVGEVTPVFINYCTWNRNSFHILSEWIMLKAEHRFMWFGGFLSSYSITDLCCLIFSTFSSLYSWLDYIWKSPVSIWFRCGYILPLVLFPRHTDIT